MSRPTRTLREDVHIHAPALEVTQRLQARAPEFWPPAVTDLDASTGLAFRLALPGRTERAALSRQGDPSPRVIDYRAGPEAGAVRGLTWVVNEESPREVHLIVEIEYEPAGGPLGWTLEETVHRAARRQVLRDALWRLKSLAEGRE